MKDRSDNTKWFDVYFVAVSVFYVICKIVVFFQKIK
jgi:hypothetical protein